jgi:60 kDa SS-A/Ro ribonucleoprotein
VVLFFLGKKFEQIYKKIFTTQNDCVVPGTSLHQQNNEIMLFNFKSKSQPVKTINHAGAPAFKMTPEMELYTVVVTSMLSDSTYEKGTDRLKRITALIQKSNPVFVAQLAVYARENMHLRSMPLVLAVELAKIHTGDDLVSRLVARVIQRADELTEILACYAMANQRHTNTKSLAKLSKQVQRGVGMAFNKFDEYQFAKYNRDGNIKLRDVLFLTHPKPKNEAQQVVFNKIARNELDTPYTWETELSALGQVKFATEAARAAAVTQKWEELIHSNKVGYMALLRNLRNILDANVSPAAIQKVCATLADPHQVRQSRQLPFRFLSAYRELVKHTSGYTGSVLSALELAVQASVVNVRGFGFDTAVAIAADVSGSMQKPISANSKIMAYDIGLMLAMMLRSKCQNVVSGMFGDTWKIIQFPTNAILNNVQEMYRREGEVGYSTNGHLVIEDLIHRNIRMDKVMLFTDCQLWNSTGRGTIQDAWTKYRAQVAPNAKLYLFDLVGYGQSPLDLSKGNGVHLIAGWSDKIFDVLAALDEGTDALKMIRSIQL